MNTEIVFDQQIKGRRAIIVLHRIRNHLLYSEWYCGYLQVLPKDKAGSLIGKTLDNVDLFNPYYPSAIDGITWCGHLPKTLKDDGKYYVGFDTNHFDTSSASAEDCKASLVNMVWDAAHEADDD